MNPEAWSNSATTSALAASVPKADLHVHQERSPRLDRILAGREGRKPLDWVRWFDGMAAETAPGLPRLRRMQSHSPAPLSADNDDETFIARVEDLLVEAARAGALLIEPRFGNETLLRPRFHELLRASVARVGADLCVAPIVAFKLGCSAEELELVLAECLRAADSGAIAGIDLICEPYDAEADWTTGRRVACEAVEAGLGVTVHAGEFTTANLAAALELPGVARVAHATQAVRDPWLMEKLAESGATVECCLTSNLKLGAVASLTEHPLPRFLAEGIPVALGTDDPVELATTIGHEYALAARLGLDGPQLTEVTRTAVRTSFATREQRAELLRRIDSG